MCEKAVAIRHIPCAIPCYDGRMENMMTIPKDRKPPRVGRICLLIGLTLLMFMVLASQFGLAAEWSGR